MNELNYASLSASKKLVDNGIVLETDYYWATYSESTLQSIRDAGKVYPRPYLVTKESIHEKHRTGHGYYPAPSFAEIWRELPWVIDNYGLISMNKVDNITCCGYRKGMAIREPKFESENPTDALIELLVWVKGEGK